MREVDHVDIATDQFSSGEVREGLVSGEIEGFFCDSRLFSGQHFSEYAYFL